MASVTLGRPSGAQAPRRGPLGAGAPEQFGDRRAFAWHKAPAAAGQAGASEPRVGVAARGSPPEECPDRVYEVVQPTAAIRAEPHLGARLKGKKSRGGRVICSEITVNGWLKVPADGGWLVTDMRGAGGLLEVAVPAEVAVGGGLPRPAELAVGTYQPQGMCCLEVVCGAGVPVRETPSRSARQLATRRAGEFVFAQTMNFDGWVKLSGEGGWMLARSTEFGELLRLRGEASRVDLWALADAWAAARGAPGRNRSLSTGQVAALKDLEQRVLLEAGALYGQHVLGGSTDRLVEGGLILASDLAEPRSERWIRQRLFAGVLRRLALEEGDLAELLPGFALASRVPPLPVEEDEEDYVDQALDQGVSGGRGGATEKALPFDYNGRRYVMDDAGVIFDPPHEVPVGIWNPGAGKIEPVAEGSPAVAVSYFGRTFLVASDGELRDPETGAAAGRLHAETGELVLNEGEELPLYQPAEDEADLIDAQEYLDRGREMARRGRLNAAACLLGEALKACRGRRSRDVELEREILRERARCSDLLGRPQALLEDAELLLARDPLDPEALSWRSSAQDLLRAARPLRGGVAVTGWNGSRPGL